MRWLKSCLRTFFSSVLRTLGMPSPSQSPTYFEFELKGPIPVDSYSTFLRREYGHSPASRKAMRVKEIHIVKEMCASEHEYVVAHIEVPDGKIMYLSFERLRGDVIDSDESGEKNSKPSSETSDNILPTTNSHQTSPDRRSSSLSSPSTVSIASCSDSISKHRIADDSVTSHENPIREAKDFDCGHLPFDDQNPLFLYELAILASSIHDDGSQYYLIGKNCYYFTRLLVNILENKYHITFQPSTAGKKPGHWNGVFVYSHANSQTIARVRGILESNILEFNAMMEKAQGEADERDRAMEKEKNLRLEAQEREQRTKDEAKAREEKLMEEAAARERKIKELELIVVSLRTGRHAGNSESDGHHDKQ